MKKVNGFILELENLKAEMERGEHTLTEDAKVLILERKQRELKKKSEQIQEEIKREIEDFFDYLNLKQASIETLNNISSYIEEEAKKNEELINRIKATESVMNEIYDNKKETKGA